MILPLNLGLRIPEDDSLRLLIEITEEMDYRELYAAYERREAAGEATAKQLFQLVVFGFMNGYYSLRELSAACRYDIRMMYLLHGKRAPSHERFGDFIRKRLVGDVMENLFSKTEHDATFMRMKENHMRNGQLKPGYNLQLGVEGEFVVTAGLFSERSDTLTLLPLLEHLKEKMRKVPERLVADSGYESEENDTGLEKIGVKAYIKPVNYEVSKTRKYKRNRFKAENMPYDEKADSFTCPAGNHLTLTGTKRSKSRSGFVSEVSVYTCTACKECPLRAKCTKSKIGRTIQRSKAFWAYRTQSHERITSELGA